MMCARPGLSSEDTVVDEMGSSPLFKCSFESGEEPERRFCPEGTVVSGEGGGLRALRRAPHPGSWVRVDGSEAPCPCLGI